MNTYGLYLHIPFCQHRCAYCDFNTYARQESLLNAYVEALCRELKTVAASSAPLQVETVFFGGGTPSLMQPAQYARILETIARNYRLKPEAEISTEANPGTLSPTGLRGLRAAGLNRLSLGVQSAHPAELRLLERSHDFSAVIRSVEAARSAGFDNLNLDLIYGLPGQSLARWEENLSWALRLSPDHLSLYALTLEQGTPFAHWARRGLLPPVDPDLVAEMYTLAQERLASLGYAQYEISNWAREGKHCRHNLIYWRGQPYLGFGAGAHGYVPGLRYSNVLSIRSYLARLQDGARPRTFPLSPAAAQRQRLAPADETEEFMMMGLRLTHEGVSATRFQQRFGQTLEDRFHKPLQRVFARGLVEWVNFPDGPHLRLVPVAYLVSNQVFVEFIQTHR